MSQWVHTKTGEEVTVVESTGPAWCQYTVYFKSGQKEVFTKEAFHKTFHRENRPAEEKDPVRNALDEQSKSLIKLAEEGGFRIRQGPILASHLLDAYERGFDKGIDVGRACEKVFVASGSRIGKTAGPIYWTDAPQEELDRLRYIERSIEKRCAESYDQGRDDQQRKDQAELARLRGIEKRLEEQIESLSIMPDREEKKKIEELRYIKTGEED